MEFSKTQKNWILGGFVVAGIIGIGVYLYKQYDKLYNALYKISSATIHNLGLSNIRITVNIKLTNKSDFSAWIINQNYDIYVNGIFVVNVKNNNRIHLNAQGDTVLPLDIEFNPEKLLSAAGKNITALLTDRSKVVFLIKGNLSLEAGALKVQSFPFDMQYTLQEIIDISKTPAVPQTASFDGSDSSHEKCPITSVEDVNIKDGVYRGMMLGYGVRMECKDAFKTSTMEYCAPIRFKTNVGLRNVSPSKVMVKVKDRRACVHIVNN